jgi:hypothetical protein
MTSCGFVDTILYTLTRRVLVSEINDSSTSQAFSTTNRTAGTHPIPEGDDGVMISLGKRGKKTQGVSASDSTEDIWNIVKTDSFEVKSETLHEQRASASTAEEYR